MYLARHRPKRLLRLGVRGAQNAKTYVYCSWSVPWADVAMCEVARTAKGTNGPDTDLNHVNKAPLRHSRMTVNFDSFYER